MYAVELLLALCVPAAILVGVWVAWRVAVGAAERRRESRAVVTPVDPKARLADLRRVRSALGTADQDRRPGAASRQRSLEIAYVAALRDACHAWGIGHAEGLDSAEGADRNALIAELEGRLVLAGAELPGPSPRLA